MRSFATSLILSSGAAKSLYTHPEFPAHIPYIPEIDEMGQPIELEFVREPLLPLATLPKQIFWNDVNGTNFLTNVRNQHLPTYCASCWAHSTTSVLSDRIKIARNAAWPDINIAPQVLLSCDHKNFGCHGGDAIQAYHWMSKNEITDETCSIYRGLGWDEGHQCSAMEKCRNCDPGEACFVPDSYYVYGVDEFGKVNGEEDMMQEIAQRGPISCGMAIPETF